MEGIRKREGRPSPYEAHVFDARAGRKLRRCFRTLDEAKAWRMQVQLDVHRGLVSATVAPTMREAADALIAGMETGEIAARGGRPFRASVCRKYRLALNAYVLPTLGPRRLDQIRRRDLLDLAGHLRRQGLAPNTVRRAIDPVRVIYRVALAREDVMVSPCAGLELPTGEVNPRDRVIDPAGIAELIAALPDALDRAIWATAFYAGLRYGELRALRWGEVDLSAGGIEVVASLDDRKVRTLPKSKAGVRRVPITPVLRRHLVALRGDRIPPADELVFGDAGEPFAGNSVHKRARRSWAAAGLQPVTLHEARHSCVTIWAASIRNAKTVQTYAGHATITQTFDRYGKHLAVADDAAADAVAAFIARHGGG